LTSSSSESSEEESKGPPTRQRNAVQEDTLSDRSLKFDEISQHVASLTPALGTLASTSTQVEAEAIPTRIYKRVPFAKRTEDTKSSARPVRGIKT